jgi:hypothetical protein
MALLERITAGLDKLGQKTNQFLDESRLRMELMRQRRRKDNLARDLGYLVYRQSQGATPAEGEIDGLTTRITEAQREIDRLQAEIETLRLPKPAEPPPG